MNPLMKTVIEYRIKKQKLQKMILENKLPMKEMTPLMLELLGGKSYLEPEKRLIIETAKRLMIEKGRSMMIQMMKSKLMETEKSILIETVSK